MIDRALLARKGELPVKCGTCGWSNADKLLVVDRYTTDYPPIPHVDLIEFYADSIRDPDDRLWSCEECGAEFDLESVLLNRKETP